MTGFFSPNPSILSTWKTTIAVAFQGLRKIKFATEDTFRYQDFATTLSYGATTATALTIHAARGLKTGNRFEFSICFTATLVGATNVITATIPYTATRNTTNSNIFGRRGGGAIALIAAISNPIVWSIDEGTNTINFIYIAGFVAGGSQVYANGFVEVNEG